MRNLSRTAGTIVDLALEMPDIDENFLRMGGAILVDLAGLLDNWQSTGARGDGARVIVDPVYGTVVELLDTTSGTATLMQIPLDPFEEEAVALILTPPYVPPPPPFPSNHDDPPEEEPPTGGDTDYTPELPVDTFGLDLVQIEGTERIGGVGYEIHVAASGGSGAIPDGSAIPGTPLTISRNQGLLELEWGVSCGASDVDYAIYEGNLGDFDSHVPVLCNNGGLTSACLPETTGDTYYLIVPTDGLTDGSYGRDGVGSERIGSQTGCRPHAVSSCP